MTRVKEPSVCFGLIQLTNTLSRPQRNNISSSPRSQNSAAAGGSKMGDSVVTEPLQYDEEDVFVSHLEDPAKKYANLTKRANAAKLAAPTIPEEEGPPAFIGSKVCWFALCWCVLCGVVIAVAVVSSQDSSDDAGPSLAPSMPDVVEATPAPSMIPVVDPTDPPTVPDEVDTTDPPEETEIPAATATPTVAPVVATEEPTMATVTAAPTTEEPTILTAAPTTEEPTILTLAPTTEEPTVLTLAPTTEEPTMVTLAPTTQEPTIATMPPSIATATMSPTVADVETPAATTQEPTPGGTDPPDATESPTLGGPFELVDLLPEYSKAALEEPTSPQSFAYLFVNYDPFFETRTQAALVQRFALATLYFGLGRMWTNGQVLPAQDECQWFSATGSFCNDDNKMEALLLGDNNLDNGPIPPEIGLLTALKQVDMSDNFITGTIPTYFGQLQSLESLSLARNERMFGTVPSELSSIATLQTLDLSGLEFLTGVVPEGVCEVESLLFECQPDSLCGCDCACAPV